MTDKYSSYSFYIKFFLPSGILFFYYSGKSWHLRHMQQDYVFLWQMKFVFGYHTFSICDARSS